MNGFIISGFLITSTDWKGCKKNVKQSKIKRTETNYNKMEWWNLIKTDA